MQFSIWCVAGGIVAGFVFGWALCALADREIIRRAKSVEKSAALCFEAFTSATRSVVSDAFWKKIFREYVTRVGRGISS